MKILTFKCEQYIWMAIFLIGLVVTFPIESAFAQPEIPATQIKINDLSLDELQQAAESGDPDAQYALGYLYFYGKTVTQNTQTGLNWIKRAAVQSQAQAIQALNILSPGNMPNHDTIATPPAETAVIGKSEQNISSHSERPALSPIKTNVKVDAKTGHTYAIQLLSAANKAELEKYIKTYSLKNKAMIQKNKHNQYILLYGHYKTHDEAVADLAKLHVALKSQKPWIIKVDSAISADL